MIADSAEVAARRAVEMVWQEAANTIVQLQKKCDEMVAQMKEELQKKADKTIAQVKKEMQQTNNTNRPSSPWHSSHWSWSLLNRAGRQ